MPSLLVPALVGVLIMGPYMYICVTGHQFVNYIGSAFLKAAPILWMSASGYALYSSLPSKIHGKNDTTLQTFRTYSRNIAIGLLFSSFGDVSLELAGKSETVFMGGIAAFLIAHLFYCRAFIVPKWSFRFALAIPVLGYIAGVLYYTLPAVEKDLAGPVTVYAFVIGCMIYNSMIRTAETESYLLTLSGATVFVISDTILAFNKFVIPGKLPNGHLIVMITYYLAQTLITLSISVPPIVTAKKDK